jgi:hypothetical protein
MDIGEKCKYSLRIGSDATMNYAFPVCRLTFLNLLHLGASVKLLPLPQAPLRARTDARTNPNTQRATQLRSVLARVYAVARQNQITTTVQ